MYLQVLLYIKCFLSHNTSLAQEHNVLSSILQTSPAACTTSPASPETHLLPLQEKNFWSKLAAQRDENIPGVTDMYDGSSYTTFAHSGSSGAWDPEGGCQYWVIGDKNSPTLALHLKKVNISKPLPWSSWSSSLSPISWSLSSSLSLSLSISSQKDAFRMTSQLQAPSSLAWRLAISNLI